MVLSTDSAEHLVNVSRMLDLHKIDYTAITETDGPYAGQLMALGLELVVDRGPVRKVVSSLPLLK